MAKIDQTWLLVDINGLFKGVIWRPFKSKKSWPAGRLNWKVKLQVKQVKLQGFGKIFWQDFCKDFGKIFVIFQIFGNFPMFWQNQQHFNENQ